VLLQVTVCVVGAQADPQCVHVGDEYELDFAGAVAAGDLQAGRASDVAGGDPIEHRYARRPAHADRFQFADVMFHRLRVATRPPGDDHSVNVDTQVVNFSVGVSLEQLLHAHRTLPS
jgi:hypothetical protein